MDLQIFIWHSSAFDTCNAVWYSHLEASASAKHVQFSWINHFLVPGKSK